MSASPPPAAAPRAFFRPGGFSLHEGQAVAEGQRLRALCGVFARDLLRGVSARLGAASFLLPALGLAVYVIVRSRVAAFAVPPKDQTVFLLDNLALCFGLNAGWLMLVHAGRVAPLIARDAWFGALLLYFSRPVGRTHYLLGRLISAALVGAALLLLPELLLLAAHLLAFGPQIGGTPLEGWLVVWLWLGAALGLAIACLVAGAVLAVVSLACGVLVRNPASAPLLFGGGILGSLAVSWVLQAAWGRESVARSMDLHHALRGLATLALAPLSPTPVPAFAAVDAATGVGLWLALALAGWLVLQRFIAHPPLGRGRS